MRTMPRTSAVILLGLSALSVGSTDKPPSPTSVYSRTSSSLAENIDDILDSQDIQDMEDMEDMETPRLSEDTSSGRLLRLDTDIRAAQETWSRYRNILEDGFFVNNSMITLDEDYRDEEDVRASSDKRAEDYFEYYNYRGDKTGDSEYVAEVTEASSGEEPQVVGEKPVSQANDVEEEPAEEVENLLEENGLEKVRCICILQSISWSSGWLPVDPVWYDGGPGGDPVEG